jgi:hypothetical protein
MRACGLWLQTPGLMVRRLLLGNACATLCGPGGGGAPPPTPCEYLGQDEG